VTQNFVSKEQTNITPVKLVYKPLYSQDGCNIFLRNFGTISPEHKE